MKTAHVNAKGLSYLKAWIEATAKEEDGFLIMSTDNKSLDAWACEAEENLCAGNPPMVEMEFATRSGKPETFVIPEDGITWWESEE